MRETCHQSVCREALTDRPAKQPNCWRQSAMRLSDVGCKLQKSTAVNSACYKKALFMDGTTHMPNVTFSSGRCYFITSLRLYSRPLNPHPSPPRCCFHSVHNNLRCQRRVRNTKQLTFRLFVTIFHNVSTAA